MTIDGITRLLRALTPAEKMELADRLYDMAVGEAEAGQPRKGHRGATVVDAGPALEPWAGFSERLVGR